MAQMEAAMDRTGRQARRYWQNHDRKQKDRDDWHTARTALIRFRKEGVLEGFLDLRRYLRRHQVTGELPRDFNLSGYGLSDDLNLTSDEYERFQRAWEATQNFC